MDPTELTEDDVYLFNEGTHHRLYRKLGAHLVDGGTRFSVWAPNAERVTVIGDFNGWDRESALLSPVRSSGIWSGVVDGVGEGTLYKLHVASQRDGYRVDKADPFGFRHETPPKTASVVASLDYDWGDADWMESRGPRNALDAPMSIYELHFASWMRDLTYRSAAEPLADYVNEQGYTHVELLPIMEHPFGGSWGYQVTGHFAPTSRFGGPADLMYLIDVLHQRGIGVILDWVPAHFPGDEHGLAFFDGTHLFEHADPRKGRHPDWDTLIYNYDRHEVRSFLSSSAVFWLDHYHVDGLRVDGVASMLYLDYSREPGEWIPNEYGGRENLGAITFLRSVNEAVYAAYPDVQTIAEESTAWPMVSRPTYLGGLGFGLKWDMGWMHDTLEYMKRDPVHRGHHHNELTFRMVYANNENFVLPLSHDEVVHGKGSLLGKMPGDDWQRMANLRLLYTYMWTMPGKKLLFQGGDIGQVGEWDHDGSVEWHLAHQTSHHGLQKLVADLNRLYRDVPALHEKDCVPDGFEWIEGNDAANSVLSFLRRGRDGVALVVLNFTPVVRENFRVGVPEPGTWVRRLSSDGADYGGSDLVGPDEIESNPAPFHGRPHSIVVTLPPLAGLILSPEG